MGRDVTDSLYADLPPERLDASGRDVGWIRELLQQSGIPVAEDEVPLVAEVYEEYEHLGAVIDAVDLPPASTPALTLPAILSDQAP
jgi:hypothetical protein